MPGYQDLTSPILSLYPEVMGVEVVLVLYNKLSRIFLSTAHTQSDTMTGTKVNLSISDRVINKYFKWSILTNHK